MPCHLSSSYHNATSSPQGGYCFRFRPDHEAFPTHLSPLWVGKCQFAGGRNLSYCPSQLHLAFSQLDNIKLFITEYEFTGYSQLTCFILGTSLISAQLSGTWTTLSTT
jgi:hypothetical protein